MASHASQPDRTRTKMSMDVWTLEVEADESRGRRPTTSSRLKAEGARTRATAPHYFLVSNALTIVDYYYY
ncbi:hypothetical protein E4U52_006845 [Claviceps spartinae]|nr:hypothetical protein E4U52_006845 [Claviceps spartinae]